MHNEDTRVKIPAILHLTRFGYKYFSLRDKSFEIDRTSNIINNVFRQQFLKINNLISNKGNEEIIDKILQEISLELNQDDLWREFFNRLIGKWESSYQLIDRKNFKNNSFHVCTELTCKNWENEFRPDITVFVNGLPLSFIEVKKPNNPEWIKAERDRIAMRFQNPAFRRFINITQLLIFSNNMEYDDSWEDQLQGAFYATISKDSKVKFNNFREEHQSDFIDMMKKIEETDEDMILKDTNYITLKHSPEFKINKDHNTPTNRILSSLLSPERFLSILYYWLTYVEEVDDAWNTVLQKHVVRYPQFFALKAMKNYISNGDKRGIIRHTQWSGKTALAYFSIKYLTDYFSSKKIVPKFYFVVDRLDLLVQASKEMKKRGIKVHTVNSRDELIKEFRQNTSKEWITIINIQKFSEDSKILNDSGYDISVQRIYFIDEAHRSYDPKWSFLANLYEADPNAIKIALTGTPLIVYNQHDKTKNEDEETLFGDKISYKTTRNIFGDYIHKYYYNDSIKDGYTLRLLREEIETSYKEKLRQVKKELDTLVKSGTLKMKDLYSHSKFVEPMLDYIMEDFDYSRIRFGDKSIGAMVVTSSSEQAREMKTQFDDRYGNKRTSALILHDEWTKEDRKQRVDDFKEGRIDVLFVYNMLLTGFDAPRLKKLYLWRKIKAHNLLQTLTRVNRPYKDFRIWYVVDFADISKEFDVTNKAYFDELNREYDKNSTWEDGKDVFWSLFMSEEEIDTELKHTEMILSNFTTNNLELFSQEITTLTERKQVLEIKQALEWARELYNISRLMGHTEALEKIDLRLITNLLKEVNNRLHLLSLQQWLQDKVDSKQLLNVAIEDVVFEFTKVGEQELALVANDLREIASKTRHAINSNRNKKDLSWVVLYEEFKKLLEEYRINKDGISMDKMDHYKRELSALQKKIDELNRSNTVLENKFQGDRKYARVYKALEPSALISNNLSLYNTMLDAKIQIDYTVQQNEAMLNNVSFFKQSLGPIVEDAFAKHSVGKDIPYDILSSFRDLVFQEYVEEYQWNIY